MSGFVAYAALAGDPSVAVPRARTMLQALRHRGPQGMTLHETPGLALGHAWLDLGDTAGPWQLRPDGPVLTGEIRLDAPEDLARQLDMPPAGDAALLLAAYDRWGIDALRRIDGDFAFALWDGAKQRMFCARDRFGVKPFVFRVTPQGLAAASEIAPLLGVFGSLQEAPDEIWIAEFLSGQPTCNSRTAWRGISRLAPGHLMILEAGRVEVRRYWTLDPEPRGYVVGPEALRDRLDRAVAARLRGGPSGAMLSGGLDSSSLALLAARHVDRPLPVFSLLFNDRPELDERPYIAATQMLGGFDQHWVGAATGETDSADLLAEQEQPFHGLGLPTSRRLYAAAAEAGVRVLLDGHGGDEVISSGVTRLQELAREGQWRSLWRESDGLAAVYGEPQFDVFLDLVAGSAGNRLLRGVARRLSGGGRPDNRQWRRMVRADLAKRTALVDRVRDANTPGAGRSPDQRHHIGLLTNPGIAAAFEVLDRSAARQGVEPRYPFFDRKLVEFCVAQPPAAKFHDGMTRALLRDAMQGVLPDSVRLRRDKSDFTINARRNLIDGSGDRLVHLAAVPGAMADYVDLGAFRAGVDQLQRGEADAPTLRQVWAALWLAEWLEQIDAPHGQTLTDRRNPA
ncbi:asparagine synthase-related protein [Cereibacter changlensis]|uniref:asparagine synthase-related protein n=1 Tax=Cereibacter changlensis TaxID=402884 RepID=UPI004033447E